MSTEQKPNALGVILERMKQRVEDDFENGKEAIYRGLVEDKAAVCQQMPEALFVNHFLPSILGEKNDNPNWMVEWIGVSGSPAAEVAVVNQKREVLFFVPPIINTSVLSDSAGGTSYGRILNMHALHQEASPVKGLLFMEDSLEQKKKDAFVKDINKQTEGYRKQWESIKARYRGGVAAEEKSEQDNGGGLDDLMA
jgi:hypothetical protein